MSSSPLRSSIIAAADCVEASRDDLCRLDAGAGDGDHGVTMALAARSVRQALAGTADTSDADLLTKVAMAMGSVGGAIGPIYASGLLAIAATLRRFGSAESLSVEQVLACAEAAEMAISSLGGAKPGNKTILDALDPAVQSLRESVNSGGSLREAVLASVAAAREGAASTASLVATVGRSSRLGERSRGVADPGATSFALIVDAAAVAYFRLADEVH